MKWAGDKIEIKNTLLRQPRLNSLTVTGKTLEIGTGDKSPDNPYVLAGVTKLTISDGGSNLQTIALPQPLYSLPDGTADEYDAVTGTGTQKVGKKILDETTSWSANPPWDAQAPDYLHVYTRITDRTLASRAVSSHFPVVYAFYSNLNKNCIRVENGTTAVYIFIAKSLLATPDAAGLKAWLAVNPVTLLYELAEPVAISGTAQTIPTYYPYTQIVNDTGGGMVAMAETIGNIKLLQMLPLDYHHSLEIEDIQNALDVKSEELRSDLDNLILQLNVETATWGLNLWEDAYGIPHEVTKPFAYRRTRIESKMRSQGITTVAMIKNVAESFSNGEVDVIEHPAEYRFDIKFIGTLGIPPNMNDLSAAIEEIKPAHLAYAYIYTYITWNDVEKYNHTWGEWDAKNLTWDEFEVYKE